MRFRRLGAALTGIFCCAQVSKAEKAMLKKQKAKEFTSAKSNSKVQKNLKRWN